MTHLLMPQLGEDVEQATVLRWLKAVGEPVAIDEPLLEIETEKVNVEVPAPWSGVLRQILVREGETAVVGAELAEIEPVDEPLPPYGAS